MSGITDGQNRWVMATIHMRFCSRIDTHCTAQGRIDGAKEIILKTALRFVTTIGLEITIVLTSPRSRM
jgi:hypothetical protein